MRICSKIMRRINHCRFTRHFGSECAFHMCAGVNVKEKMGSQPTTNWFTFLKIEVILINKEKFNFIYNNMSIMMMALETRLTKYLSQHIHKFTLLEFLIRTPTYIHFTRPLELQGPISELQLHINIYIIKVIIKCVNLCK